MYFFSDNLIIKNEKNNIINENDEINEISAKVNLFALGNAGVGKTCFIKRYTDNIFDSDYVVTLGIDSQSKIVTLPNGQKINVVIYDTAGEERYRSISLNTIRLADGILLMYDITDVNSFKCIPGWIKSISEAKGEDFPIILIGNKCDLNQERKITKEEGKKEAGENGLC